MTECIFCKIRDGSIPAKMLYADEELMAFYDINPSAPIHVLLVPKTHIANTLEINEQDQLLMGHMIVTANKIAKDLGLHDGYKLQINTGKGGGQEVFHLHLHLLGSKRL
jgi:histidine triad (HIT) family protein